MGKRNCELVAQDPASVAKAELLLAGLWLGVSEGLTVQVESIEAYGYYPDSLREANVAKNLVDDWRVLSERAVNNPKSLTLRSCELTRTQKLVETNLFDGDGGKVVLSTKYSILSAIFDCKPIDYKFGGRPEEGTPQLEVNLVELYSDSLREARAAMSGTLNSQVDVGLTKSPEKKYGDVGNLEIEAFLIGKIAARKLNFMGKTTWYDTVGHTLKTWDLAGFQLNEAVSPEVCPFEAQRRMKFGKMDDQTGVHPLSYEHKLLEESAPALFTAVEPLAKMVVKNIEKSKR